MTLTSSVVRRQRGTEQHQSKDPSIPRSERSPQRDLAGEGSTRHQDCRGHSELALGVSINPKRTGLSQRTRFVRSDTTAKQSRCGGRGKRLRNSRTRWTGRQVIQFCLSNWRRRRTTQTQTHERIPYQFLLSTTRVSLSSLGRQSGS